MVLGLPPLVVYFSAAIAACTIGFTRPTQGALLPELSRTPEELSVANGVSGTVEGAGLFIGPLAAAAILTVGPPALVFAVGAIVYVVAASLVVSLPATAHPPAVEADASSDPTAGVSRAEPLNILDGIRVLRQNADVRLVVTLLALRGLVIGALDVLFILLALEVYGTGQPGAGILTGALGVGTMLGGAAAFSLVGRRRLAPALAFAVSVCGFALVATAVLGTGTTAPFLIVIAGVGSAAADVAGRTILQRTTPDAVLGRVLGNLEGFYLFGMSLGSVLVPVIAVAKESWRLEQLQARLPGIGFYNCFGQSEIAPLATVLRPEQHAERPDSAGKAVLFVDMRVVDDELRDVAPGEVGEVVYRSPQLCRGYWEKPEETEEAFQGGWFHSGDLARIDAQHFITIVDRKKDVINTGGVVVASREVEDQLYTHPAVKEVAVVATSDPKWIEAVTAIVVLKPDAQATAEELIAHARQRLAPFKVPKVVHFVADLPRNASGKILKRELRKRFS